MGRERFADQAKVRYTRAQRGNARCWAKRRIVMRITHSEKKKIFLRKLDGSKGQRSTDRLSPVRHARMCKGFASICQR